MIRIFTIPFDVNQGTFDESSLNQFLLNKKLNNMVIRFFTLGDNAYWTAFLDVDPILKDVKSRENRQMGKIPGT